METIVFGQSLSLKAPKPSSRRGRPKSIFRPNSSIESIAFLLENALYKSIDNNREVGELSALEYYIKRGSHFVNENGFLVVIHSPSNDIPFEKLEKLAGMKIVKQFKDKDLEYLSYEAIVFKNN